MTSTWIQSQPAFSTAVICMAEAHTRSDTNATNHRTDVDIIRGKGGEGEAEMLGEQSFGCADSYEGRDALRPFSGHAGDPHAWGAHAASPEARTCSPSLAKLADRIDGDTMMSFFENLSTLCVALTDTDRRPARLACLTVVRLCPWRQVLKEAMSRFAYLTSNYALDIFRVKVIGLCYRALEMAGDTDKEARREAVQEQAREANNQGRQTIRCLHVTQPGSMSCSTTRTSVQLHKPAVLLSSMMYLTCWSVI